MLQIHYKNNKCIQCKIIYGDARMNARLIDIATPAEFKRYSFDECYEIQENYVPYGDFCYEMYFNHTEVLRKSIIDQIHEDTLCTELHYC